MLSNSAAISNLQSDLYRVVKNALSGNDRQLEEIKNLLIEIRNAMVNHDGESHE